MIGITKASISKYESGATIPSKIVLNKIADYGGVTVEWLLRGEAAVPELREHAPETYEGRPLPSLDEDLLIQVVATVEEYLAEHKMKRRPLQKGRLFAKLYEHCLTDKERPNSLLVKRYLPLAD